MQQSRFMVLTGHLSDYPLSDLVGILRHQQKTGRLLIEYPNGPAMFFFKNGEFVDAQFDNLNGLQAICVAVAQPPSPFNFNPLIAPSRRSIQNSLQKAVSELLGCWDESGTDVEITAIADASPAAALPGRELALEAGSMAKERLALPAFVERSSVKSYRPMVVGMAAAGLMMLGLSSVIAVASGLLTAVLSASPEPSASSPKSQVAKPEPNTRSAPSYAQLESNSDAETIPDRPRLREASSAEEPRAVKKNERENESRTVEVAQKQSTETPEPEQKRVPESTGGAQSIKVVLQIENGRVLRASIANPQSGRDAYEALALRIARQRRYPPDSVGQETVTIRINTPSQTEQ